MTIRLTLGALNAGQERAYLDRLRERYDGEVVALPGAAVLLDGLGELPWAIVTSGSRTTLPRRADGSDCRRGQASISGGSHPVRFAGLQAELSTRPLIRTLVDMDINGSCRTVVDRAAKRRTRVA